VNAIRSNAVHSRQNFFERFGDSAVLTAMLVIERVVNHKDLTSVA
jgi:hypothetical protein